MERKTSRNFDGLSYLKPHLPTEAGIRRWAREPTYSIDAPLSLLSHVLGPETKVVSDT